MVDSQDTNQTYDQGHQHPTDDCTMLSQIPTNDLMDLDQDFLQQLDFNCLEPLNSIDTPSATCGFEPEDEKKPLLFVQLPPTPATPSSVLLDHLTKTPTLDEVNDPSYNFNVDLNGETSGKSSWMFSSRLNKVFVKMGQACTFNVSYQCLSYQELNVRAMMVCSAPEDMHQPVFRCENHRCADNNNPNLEDEVKLHVLRCFNPSARYVGNEKGVAYKDRLAVIVPMGTSTQETVSQNISLEFVCQNSCRVINRRATAIIFTLEDAQGQILGKKALHLKVCSCPKRDKQKEEESLAPTKRKSDTNLEAPPGKKVAKVALVPRTKQSSEATRQSPTPMVMVAAGKLPFIKKEPSPDSPRPTHKSRRAGSLTPSNSVELVDGNGALMQLAVPSVEIAAKVAEYAFQVVAGELVRTSDSETHKRLASYMSSLRRVHKEFASGRTTSTNSSTDSE